MVQVLFWIPSPWGDIPIPGFGLMLFLAFIFCTMLASRRALKEGIRDETIQDLAVWIFLGGLLGARVTYLLSDKRIATWSEFLDKLWRIWEGGIVLYGSIVGGLLSYFLAWFLIYRHKGLETRRLIDVIAPAICLGLVLGRIGCLLNGCCYGGPACADSSIVTPITFPICAPCRDPFVDAGYQTVAGFSFGPSVPAMPGGVVVDHVDPQSPAYAAGLRPGSVITEVNGISVPTRGKLDLAIGSLVNWPRGQSWLDIKFRPSAEEAETTARIYPRTIAIYPTQLYETISMLLLMMVVFAYDPLRKNPGQVCAVLMIGYGIHRSLNELLRVDERPEGFERWGSVILISSGVLLWLWLQIKPQEPPAKPLEPEKPKPQATPA
jgi:phosphatidylglycerol:prolipoprotein diacylglycerol transferase